MLGGCIYQEGTDLVRFVSVPDFSNIHIGSVRFGSDNQFSRFDAVRPGFFGRVVARSGSVRFVSAFSFGRFQNLTVWLGSVWFFIPSCMYIYIYIYTCIYIGNYIDIDR